MESEPVGAGLPVLPAEGAGSGVALVPVCAVFATGSVVASSPLQPISAMQHVTINAKEMRSFFFMILIVGAQP